MSAGTERDQVRAGIERGQVSAGSERGQSAGNPGGRDRARRRAGNPTRVWEMEVWLVAPQLF